MPTHISGCECALCEVWRLTGAALTDVQANYTGKNGCYCIARANIYAASIIAFAALSQPDDDDDDNDNEDDGEDERADTDDNDGVQSPAPGSQEAPLFVERTSKTTTWHEPLVRPDVAAGFVHIATTSPGWEAHTTRCVCSKCARQRGKAGEGAR